MEESITYYDDHCERFVKETFEIDMSFVYQPFLELVPAGGRLLDAGCGSGRDALAFSRLGFEVDAFDASSRCVEQARTLTGLQIEQLRFDEMAFENEFDGIWACASLLHVRRQQLDEVLGSFHRALRDHGVAYLSFKKGDQDTEKDGRYFTNFTLGEFDAWVSQAQGWICLEAWLSEDLRPDRQKEFWVNGLLKKIV
jgi:SAM-dependent methyltransferase